MLLVQLILPPTCLVVLWFYHPFNLTFIPTISVGLLVAGFFPVSAIAFYRLEIPAIVNQITRDCKLLGTDREPEQLVAQHSSRWSLSSYMLFYTLAVVAALLGVGMFFAAPVEPFNDVNTVQAMRVGFLGAYIYCLGLVYRRYTTLDLQPHIYMLCAISMMSGMIFNYVAFEAINGMIKTASVNAPNAAIAAVATSPNSASDQVSNPGRPNLSGVPSGNENQFLGTEFTSLGAGLAAILAFSLGYFPNLAVGWFGQLSHTILRQNRRRSDDLPLSLVDGISDLHETRLRDEGIDNVQNLAAANIRDLVIKTPFSAQQIIEWIDQAVLYLYLDPTEISSFRRAGARCVSDLEDLWKDYFLTQQSNNLTEQQSATDSAGAKDLIARRQAIAQQFQTTTERMDSLFRATEFGPNMHFVRTYWNSVDAIEKRARMALIQDTCGLVGCSIRTIHRAGLALTEVDAIRQAACTMLSESALAEELRRARNDVAAALYGRAFLNRLLGNRIEAFRLYEQCTKEYKNDPAAYNDLAWMKLDDEENSKDEYEDAKKKSEKAVELAKTTPEFSIALPGYLDTLAVAYARLGDPDKALIQWKEATRLWKKQHREEQPRFYDSLLIIGRSFLKAAKINEAKNIFTEILAQQSNIRAFPTASPIKTLFSEAQVGLDEAEKSAAPPTLPPA